jgi:hypothetical protein
MVVTLSGKPISMSLEHPPKQLSHSLVSPGAIVMHTSLLYTLGNMSDIVLCAVAVVMFVIAKQL